MDSFKTPTTVEHFVFPPNSHLTKSLDRSKVVRFKDPPIIHSRLSSTPCKSLLFMETPDVSPIEFSFSKLKQEIVRLPPESVCKAPADSTVNILENLPQHTEELHLMPPPASYRRPFRSTSFNTGVPNHHLMKENIKRSPLLKDIKDRLLLDHNINRDAFGLHMSMNNKMQSPGEKSFLNQRISLSSTLTYIGLRKYIEIFQREEIDFDIFLTLSDENLITIGVTDQKDRETILNFIKELSIFRSFERF